MDLFLCGLRPHLRLLPDLQQHPAISVRIPFWREVDLTSLFVF